MESKPYGVGKILIDMDIDKLKRLYNSGGMPAPMTKDGYYDLKTIQKIQERIRCGY